MNFQKITFYPVSCSPPTPTVKPLVMITDDSPTVRKIVEITLRRAGYEVVAVPDGVEALRFLLTVLKEHGVDHPALAPSQMIAAQEGLRLPDLILLDVQMPRMDGYTLAMKIRKRPQLAHIPLVMLTRRTGIVERLKARLAGVRGYLIKPFTQRDLHTLVTAFIGPADINQDDSPQPSRSVAGR